MSKFFLSNFPVTWNLHGFPSATKQAGSFSLFLCTVLFLLSCAGTMWHYLTVFGAIFFFHANQFFFFKLSWIIGQNKLQAKNFSSRCLHSNSEGNIPKLWILDLCLGFGCYILPAICTKQGKKRLLISCLKKVSPTEKLSIGSSRSTCSNLRKWFICWISTNSCHPVTPSPMG